MTKHLLPPTALIAYAAAKRKAALATEAEYSRQLSLDVLDIRQALFEQRRLQAADED